VQAVRRSLGEHRVSERRVCRVLDQSRRMQRYAPVRRADEDSLEGLIISLAGQYGVYGYRIIWGMMGQIT
jgi:putative transposase